MSFLSDHCEVRENLRTTYQADPVEVSWAEREAVRRRHEKQFTPVDLERHVLEDCVLRIFDLLKEDRALEIGKAVIAARNAYLDRCVDRELDE